MPSLLFKSTAFLRDRWAISCFLLICPKRPKAGSIIKTLILMFLVPASSLVLILSGFAAGNIGNIPKKDTDLHFPIATPHRHINTGMARTRSALSTRVMSSCCAQGIPSSPVSWSACPSRDKNGRPLMEIICKVWNRCCSFCYSIWHNQFTYICKVDNDHDSCIWELLKIVIIYYTLMFTPVHSDHSIYNCTGYFIWQVGI